MPKHQYITDLTCQGMRVDSRFFVREPQRSNGKSPHKFTLQDRTGEIAAKMWPSNPGSVEWESLAAAQYADVTGVVEYSSFSHKLEVTVVAFAPVDEPLDLADYMRACPLDLDGLWAAVGDLVSSMRNSVLRRLLEALFEQPAVRRGYVEAPAAQRLHHPYIGGLLEHSLEVARLCDAMANTLPETDRDLLVAAALLHDIGKIDEIDYRTPAFGYTRAGGMLGHVFLGAERVRAAFREIEGPPSGLSDTLCHMILSHHGKREYGAPTVPCILEAYVLSSCDELSTRRYYCRAAADKQGAAMFEKQYPLEGPVYTRARDWDASDVTVRETPWPRTGYDEDGPSLRGLISDEIMLPLLGSVAAGIPIAEQQDVLGYFPARAGDGAREGDFLLRVKGDSMVGDEIRHGDAIHVRPAEVAGHGEIVVALVDGESTVKRLVLGRGAAVLRASNPAYADIAASQELRIQGKVLGVYLRA